MCEDGYSGVRMSLQEDSLFEGVAELDVEQIVPHRLGMRMVLDI